METNIMGYIGVILRLLRIPGSGYAACWALEVLTIPSVETFQRELPLKNDVWELFRSSLESVR